MGLGILLGLAALGATLAACEDPSSNHTPNRHTSERKYVQHTYKPVNHYVNNDVSYERKVEFYDAYREVDSNLARMYGESIGGFACLRYAIKTRKITDSNLKELYPLIVEVHNYRSKLSHGRSKWKYIEDPGTNYVRTLRIVDKIASYFYADIGRALYRQDREHKAHQHR